jgi:hypothetical protein
MCRTCVFPWEFEWTRQLIQPHQTNHGNRVGCRAPDSMAPAKPADAGLNISPDLWQLVGCVRTKCNVRIVRRLRDYEGISRKPGITVLDHSTCMNISMTSDNICHIKSPAFSLVGE